MLTADDLHAAPMFTVFHGLKGKCVVRKDANPEWWDKFSLVGATVFDDEVDEKARSLEIKVLKDGPYYVEVEAFNECPEGFEDADAALCYLNEGGVLAKLPDTMDSKYYRLYVVDVPKGVKSGEQDKLGLELDPVPAATR